MRKQVRRGGSQITVASGSLSERSATRHYNRPRSHCKSCTPLNAESGELRNLLGLASQPSLRFADDRKVILSRLIQAAFLQQPAQALAQAVGDLGNGCRGSGDVVTYSGPREVLGPGGTRENQAVEAMVLCTWTGSSKR